MSEFKEGESFIKQFEASQLILNRWESKLCEQLKERTVFFDPPNPKTRWENIKFWLYVRFKRLKHLRFWFYYRWPYGEVGREED